MGSTFKLGLALASLFGVPEFSPAEDCSSCSGCLWTLPSSTLCLPSTSQLGCDGWGAQYTWCGAGAVKTADEEPSTTEPTAALAPEPTTTTPPATETNKTASALVFSPYIDTGMGTGASLVTRLDKVGMDTISLAFASGECGSEEWAGEAPETVLDLIHSLVKAKKKYIISSGGAAGSFTCATGDGLVTFIDKYATDYLIGIDFDIEVGQTQKEIDQLVRGAKSAQKSYPNLRFSFTIAAYGKAPNKLPINPTGELIMASIKENKLTDYYINLMVMDIKETTHCIVTEGTLCDMGASAVNSAQLLNRAYGVPFSQIELTVMIGGNDFESNVFNIDDVKEVTDYAKASGLGGVHYWSLDRDEDCKPGPASSSCNSYGKAGSLGFSKAFVAELA